MLRFSRKCSEINCLQDKGQSEPVAAISSEWWRDGGLGAEPLVRGRSPPEAEKKSNFDNTKPL